MKEAVEYNLALLEGQLARFESAIGGGAGLIEMRDILQDTKQYLAALRLVLDPHRIDVI